MIDSNISNIISSLSIKERLSLLSGDGYWTSKAVGPIISLYLTDGPHGIRKQSGLNSATDLNKSLPSIAFPTASCSACSFDKSLLFKEGVSLAHEAKRLNVDVVLGPGINIKRSPLCGRNFEYFSEDPLLSGDLATSLCKGIQSQGISSCIKHFACNNQEKFRFIENSIVDERTLNEIYLSSFCNVINNAHPDCIMGSYNMINGSYVCESKDLLVDYLRGDLNYKGLIMTDWGAISDPLKSFKSGLNLEMPGVDKTRIKYLYKDYKNGLLSEEEINNAIAPLISLSTKHKDRLSNNNNIDTLSNDLDVAEEIATNSIILAKNNNNVLPLKESQHILVIGKFAASSRYQGSGSSLINPIENDSFLQVLDYNGVSYEFAPGFSNNDSDNSKNFIEQAASLSKFNDTILLFLGLPSEYEGEGFDKKDLKLPNSQIELVNRLSSLNKKIIVIVEAGSPVELPFIDKIDALLIPYLAGCRVNKALYKILFGLVSPSGHFAETYPLFNKELPIKNYANQEKDIYYKEGQYIGYRYYINKNEDVLFPFGFGLSYTKFNYKNICFINNILSFDLSNCGKCSGKEVIQIYVSSTQNGHIYKSLKYFDKINLLPKETKHIEIKIDNEYFMFYSILKHKFVVGTGTFTISLGSSCLNDIYSKELNIKGDEDYLIPDDNITLENNFIRQNNIKKHYDINSSLKDLSSCHLGKFLYKQSNKFVNKAAKENPDSEKMLRPMLQEGPLRILVMGSNGKISLHQIQGLIDLLNGHFFKGIHKLIHK